ncbi:hypothetical protein AAG589_07810 [Isoptericola sp. F-RaC21]|uniref:hypothetical protein n=1 Tax=Isoptericola sp. F-RaC21 TaxID=3141452 RepID=UPI00315B762A
MGALTACSHGDPQRSVTPAASANESSSPSPAKSVDPAEQLKQDNIDDAKATLIDYYETGSEVANNSYEDWDRLQEYWGNPDVATPLASLYESEKQAGNYTKGATKVISMNVTDYVDDPTDSGAEKVSIRACVDTTGTTAFNKDGSRSEGGVDRYVNVYTMQHQGVDGPWRISKDEPDMTRTC